ATAFGNATVTIVNINAPGVGFNDPTPVAPVGGNPGTTLGQQRLIAAQFAGDLWAATLDSSVEIRVQASFATRTCNATSAVLASAGPIQIFANFPGAEHINHWYAVALANKRSGLDLAPADGSNGPPNDLQIIFNINLGQPGCLTGSPFYYGLDANEPAGQVDLVATALHEFGHGLGFTQFASVTTGALPLGLPDVYNRNLYDLTQNKAWPSMTNAERSASAINPRKVIWTGPRVTLDVPAVLSLGTPLLKVNSPPAIAGNYEVGAATFGPQLSAPGITGNVVLALDPADGAGPSTTDGCSPLTNAAAVAGNIAILDRGTCGFIVKVKNAQNAGAIAVIVADNVAGGPPAGLGGTDPTITISSVRITLSDGNAIKSQLGTGVNVTLGVDQTLRAGADPLGRALMYTPNPVAPGSTISHWDTSMFPNQIMEPSINGDLPHIVSAPQDLTLSLMRDIGWYEDRDLDMISADADCDDTSDFSPTVVIAGCDTGVPNMVFTDGCTLSDKIQAIGAGASNHGDFVSGVSHLTNALKKAGHITGAQKSAIQSCAAGASIP
ncbi:MAG TPA: PA domain-containing protein, partial [Pyrinomonadaceae bacterium]|nr:PA domain-containing protein [Pyrinomonadaceae bacterium]